MTRALTLEAMPLTAVGSALFTRIGNVAGRSVYSLGVLLAKVAVFLE